MPASQNSFFLKLLLVAFLTIQTIPTGWVGSTVQPSHTITKRATLLLSRLNLDAPGLEKVKANAQNPERAARELLAYYRKRTTVKHPADRQHKAVARG